MISQQDFLSKISHIDENIDTNRDIASQYSNNCKKQSHWYKILQCLHSFKFITLNLIISSLSIYFLLNKIVLTIIITLLFCLMVNIIVILLLQKSEDAYEENFVNLTYYNEEYLDLINIRNTYSNLYNYSLYGDEVILQNIRLKIQKGAFYDYNLCLNKIWLNQDQKALKLLTEMRDKQEIMIRDLKIDIANELKNNHTKEQTNFLNNLLYNLN